ncbi:MAG: hypothetical protein ACKPFK_15090, partial [Dolichospermum sp.]
MQVTFNATAPANAFHYVWSYYDYSLQTWVTNTTTTNTFTTTFNQPGTNTFFYLDVYDVDWGYLGTQSINILTKGSTPTIYSSLQTFCPNSEVLFWTNSSATSYTLN